MNSNLCKNCNYVYKDTDLYCSQCGQETHLHRFNLGYLIHEFIHYTTHADKGIFHLIKSLTLTSGRVAREYLLGKRKKYFPPINFFFIVAAIYVISASWNNKPLPIEADIRNSPPITFIKDSVQKEATIKIFERAAKSKKFLNKNANALAIAALPFICLIFYISYKNSDFNYVEQLLANMYMSAYTLLIRVVIFVPLFYFLNLKNSYVELSLFFIFQVLYFSWFYYTLTAGNSKLKMFKAFAVSFITVICWVALSGFFISIYIKNGLWGLLH